MMDRGLGIGVSSNVCWNCSRERAAPPSPHAAATEPSSPRCSKTPELVFGFDRNGCTNSVGICTQRTIDCTRWLHGPALWETRGVSGLWSRRGREGHGEGAGQVVGVGRPLTWMDDDPTGLM